MLENDRLRQVWDELPKTPHGVEITTRHSDVLPEWIIRIIESPDSRGLRMDGIRYRSRRRTNDSDNPVGVRPGKRSLDRGCV